MSRIGSNERDRRLRRDRIRVLITCAVSNNLALGLAYGSFGPLLKANQQHFGVSLASAVLGASIISISLGLLSPLVGRFIANIRIKLGMIAGAVASAAGYFGLAFAQDYRLGLICYALLGVGLCLSGLVGPMTLIARWYDEGRGRAMSIAMLPLLLFIAPFLVALLLPLVGREAILASFGILFVMLVPILCFGLKERLPAFAAAQTSRPGRSPLTSEGFWLIAIIVGLSAGAGTVYIVHAVSFGESVGMSLTTAAAMTSVYTGAGVVGMPLFGWLSDRLGPARALVLNIGVQAALWFALPYCGEAMLFVIAGFLGLCTVATTALLGSSLAGLFGVDGIGRAVGYAYFVKLPFLFAWPPVAALIYDWTASYRFPFLMCAIGMAVSLLLALRFLVITTKEQRHLIDR